MAVSYYIVTKGKRREVIATSVPLSVVKKNSDTVRRIKKATAMRYVNKSLKQGRKTRRYGSERTKYRTTAITISSYRRRK